MLRQFPIQAYRAVTDFEFYPTVFEQPLQRSLLFLLYLSGTVAALLTLIYAGHYAPEVDRFFAWAHQNFPAISVEQGKLRVEADQPLLIKYANGETWTLVFDTTGTYTDPVGLEEPVLLFSRDNLYLRNQGQTNTYPWLNLGDFSVSQENLDDYRATLEVLYFPIGYGFFLLFNLLAKAIQALLLSPLAFSVGASYGVRLPLSRCFTIALYSLIPAIVVDLAVRLTGLNIAYFDIIYLAAAAVYTFLATQRCSVAH